MREKKIALVVADGSEKVAKLALAIVKTLKNFNVVMKEASAFAGTDLLPADAFFLGCEKPSPPSFGYLEEMLQHINLADRTCGVFSPSPGEAVQYLNKILKNSEVILYPESLTESNIKNIKKWTAKVTAGRTG